MAVKSPHPEGEPWVPIVDVLAEVAGMDPSRTFAGEAEAQAARIRGVRRDWCGRPCITWSTAAELLASLRAEQARVLAGIEQRAIEADKAFRAALPSGIPVGMVPEGLTPAMLMMAADPMQGAGRRESVVEHALANPDGALIYHPIGGES
jgi:hypothetical protein